MKTIYFLFTGGRKQTLANVRSAAAPSEFFYAGPELEKLGFKVEYLEYDDFNYREGRPKFLFFGKEKLVDSLGKAENLAKLNQADFLVATTNGYGSALAELKAQKKLSATIIFLPMGILEIGSAEAKKQSVHNTLTQGISFIISKNEMRYLQAQFPDLSDRFKYLSFGVDTRFWRPAPNAVTQTPYVLSIGNDQHRDYELLIKAWKPSYPQLRIITKRVITAPLPANVTVQAGDWRGKLFSDNEIRTLMQESIFGVLPIRETIQPSGQSACLQMMACGKAVIISRMAGLWDEDGMRHNETCLLPKPGSIEDMQKCVEALLADAHKVKSIGTAAQQVVTERFTTAIMADDFKRIIESYGKS